MAAKKKRSPSTTTSRPAGKTRSVTRKPAASTAKKSASAKVPSKVKAAAKASPGKAPARKTATAGKAAAKPKVPAKAVAKAKAPAKAKPPVKAKAQMAAPTTRRAAGTQPTTAKKAPGKAAKATTAAPRRPARSKAGAGAPATMTTGTVGLIHGIPPYQPRPGEAYMNDRQREHFRHILLAWKRELMEGVDRTVHHMQDEASNFPDPNDRATQESEFGLELRTRDRERKLLKKIDAALGRIEDGSYGYCEETGEEIGLKRLEARPVATLSVEAQERREVAERQYRDREDGF